MNLSDVMDELAARIDAIDGLRVFAYEPDTLQPPAAVVTFPESYDYDATYGRGSDRMTIPVVVMVGRASDRAARGNLSRYVDGSGAASLKAVIEADSEDSYLQLPGAAGSYASTPDRDAIDLVTGDVDIRADIAADDWTPTSVQSLVAKAISGGNWAYQLGLRTDGKIRLTWSVDGSATLQVESTVAPTVVNGARLAVRCAFDANNGSNERVGNFYTAPTIAGPWTALGATVTQAGATSIFATGSAQLEVGTRNNGALEPFAGRVYAAEVRNVIDGTVMAAPDFRRLAAGAYGLLDRNGLPFAVHGSGAITAGAPAVYTAFDSARVTSVEFDVVTMAGVEHVMATLSVDVIGDGS